MPCRLLVLHALLYTNIVNRKSGPFGGNLDKNATNWLEQSALAIFWRFLTPGNKRCFDWSWFQTIYPISIFDILFPFPVTKSQSQWLKSHFPSAKTGQSQFPFYPFRTLLLKNRCFRYSGNILAYFVFAIITSGFFSSLFFLFNEYLWAWFPLSANRILFAAKHSWTTLSMSRPLFLGGYSQVKKNDMERQSGLLFDRQAWTRMAKPAASTCFATSNCTFFLHAYSI